MQRSDLIDEIFYSMSQFKRLMHAQAAHRFDELKLSPAQIEILHVINSEGPVSVKQLATTLQLTPGAVSQFLEGLDSQQFLLRVSSPTDRRSSNISLSEAGKAGLAQAIQIRRQYFNELFSTLSDEELAAYKSIQHKIINHLQQKERS